MVTGAWVAWGMVAGAWVRWDMVTNIRNANDTAKRSGGTICDPKPNVRRVWGSRGSERTRGGQERDQGTQRID